MQLSLIQTAPVTGAIVVTTPSAVSLEDARKAVLMFQQVKVPVLGMVENMSYLQCPHCDERIDVFSNGGGKRTAEAMSINFLGALPLDPHVRIGGDTGHPVATAGPEDKNGGVYYELAGGRDAPNEAEASDSNIAPTMTVSDERAITPYKR